MSALRDRVMEGLEDVIDPCSVTAGAPLSIVDMGLLNELCVDDDGAVRVSMRATSAMCTMIAGIMKVAEERLARVEGVTRVEVQLCSGGIWTEAGHDRAGAPDTCGTARALARGGRRAPARMEDAQVAPRGGIRSTS